MLVRWATILKLQLKNVYKNCLKIIRFFFFNGGKTGK